MQGALLSRADGSPGSTGLSEEYRRWEAGRAVSCLDGAWNTAVDEEPAEPLGSYQGDVMKVSTMQKPAARLFESGEPVLVTWQGKVSGLYVPLEYPERVPDDLRRDLLGAVGRYVAGALEDKGVSEEEILEDFSDFRRRRR
jgi:hypothetical protein